MVMELTFCAICGHVKLVVITNRREIGAYVCVRCCTRTCMEVRVRVRVCVPGYSRNRLWFTHSFIPILAACEYERNEGV